MTVRGKTVLVDKLIGLRVAPGEQAIGLDLADYGEDGYMLGFLPDSGPKLEGNVTDPTRHKHADGRGPKRGLASPSKT